MTCCLPIFVNNVFTVIIGVFRFVDPVFRSIKGRTVLFIYGLPRTSSIMVVAGSVQVISGCLVKSRIIFPSIAINVSSRGAFGLITIAKRIRYSVPKRVFYFCESSYCNRFGAFITRFASVKQSFIRAIRLQGVSVRWRIIHLQYMVFGDARGAAIWDARVNNSVRHVNHFPFRVNINRQFSPLRLFNTCTVSGRMPNVSDQIIRFGKTGSNSRLYRYLVPSCHAIAILTVERTRFRILRPIRVVFRRIFFTSAPYRDDKKGCARLIIFPRSKRPVTTSYSNSSVFIIRHVSNARRNMRTKFYPYT